MFSSIDLVVKEAKKMDQDPLSYPDVLFADNPMGTLSSLTDGLTPQEPDEAEFRSQQKQRLFNAAGEDMVTSYHDVRRQMADTKKTINILQNNQKRTRDEDDGLDCDHEKKRQRTTYEKAEQIEFPFDRDVPRRQPCAVCGWTNHRTQDCCHNSLQKRIEKNITEKILSKKEESHLASNNSQVQDNSTNNKKNWIL